ncbi:MAG: hypothetical protein PHV05_03745 [Candidatus Riflebacteria bacterium]|nr:hypothetical protein [Candidatus Riflebacteria bacterium]
MESQEIIQRRAAVTESTALIQKLSKLSEGATPQRAAQLKQWADALIDNNKSADSETIRRGIKQIESKLSEESAALKVNAPRSTAEIIQDQTQRYKRSMAQDRRLDRIYTQTGHLGKEK